MSESMPTPENQRPVEGLNYNLLPGTDEPYDVFCKRRANTLNYFIADGIPVKEVFDDTGTMGTYFYFEEGKWIEGIPNSNDFFHNEAERVTKENFDECVG